MLTKIVPTTALPWGWFDAALIEATLHPVAAEYPLHSTLSGTLTCSNHSGSVI